MEIQVYSGYAVGLTSLIGLAGGVNWSGWGILGACLWVLSQPLAMIAVRLLGVALAPALWAATTIAISFFYGYLLFDEPVSK